MPVKYECDTTDDLTKAEMHMMEKLMVGDLVTLTSDHTGYGLGQWEKALLSNASSH